MTRRLFPLLLALLLLCPVRAGGAEDGQTVYFLGNFAFGMPIEAVRALDAGGAALTVTDAGRELQRVTFLSDNFVVSLWFDGLEDTAPLVEMDFAFFMEPDTVTRRGNDLEIQTAKQTVNTVYTYVESLCKKTFGKGKNAPDGALPVPSLLFPDNEASPSLTRLRVYILPDAGKTDVIVHLVANGEYSVNYVILRQKEL
ncbi:MAG: hypothetical protein IKO52_15260 [Clostridia bacterium]|nr:hypothetical protein [Clostridia bacterium]